MMKLADYVNMVLMSLGKMEIHLKPAFYLKMSFNQPAMMVDEEGHGRMRNWTNHFTYPSKS